METAEQELAEGGSNPLYMPLYEGTKRLRARPMTRGEYNRYRGWETPADENGEDAGYLVEYVDGGEAQAGVPICHTGYISWSPADVFEKHYHGIEAGAVFGFGEALRRMKDGKRVARVGWNGKGMFAYLVPAASYPVQTGAAKAFFGEGSMVPYRAYLALKTVDDDVATWAPSCSDVLADDWTEVHVR